MGSTTMRAFALEHPIAVGIGLLLIALVFRLLDIFVFRLDERWGEIIVSKVVAVLLLLAFLAATGAGLAAVGFHSRALGPSLLLGIGLTAVALLAGYAIEFIRQAQAGQQPEIVLRAIDPKTGLAGALGFALFLLIGNVVNSFAEEGLFRGVLIPLFLREINPWPALLASAFLFGAWHLPWALKSFLDEENAESIAALLVSSFLPQALLGIVWGLLYLCTGNLWGAWAAHTLTNSALNFVHIESVEGTDSGLPTRMIIFTIVMLLGWVLIWWVARAWQLPSVVPWGTAGPMPTPQ